MTVHSVVSGTSFILLLYYIYNICVVKNAVAFSDIINTLSPLLSPPPSLFQSVCAARHVAVSLQQAEQNDRGGDDVRCHGIHATAAGAVWCGAVQWTLPTAVSCLVCGFHLSL